MGEAPYSNQKDEDLILRDWLAVDRTALANERTLLSYVRTSLTLFVVGASLLKFFDSYSAAITGWVFIALGAATFGIGVHRFRKMRLRIKSTFKR